VAPAALEVAAEDRRQAPSEDGVVDGVFGNRVHPAEYRDARCAEVTMSDEQGTWHHGLAARWWAEFTVATPPELAYYRGAVERFGEPALDLACGTGRLLVPLSAGGLDVDGADVSADMLALCDERAKRDGAAPALHRQAMHELDLPRQYRTIFICDSFGLGGSRRNDLETLRRVHRHLAPNGGFVLNVWPPYAQDEASWMRWLPSRRAEVPEPWPESGDRRRLADGGELEWITRLADLDPLEQRQTLEMRARLWRGSELVKEETHALLENLYFVEEVLLMLSTAGFSRFEVQGGYEGRAATREDGMVVIVAQR
jgi:SAM-dependent methyltransferase